MIIRALTIQDSEEVLSLIHNTLININSKDYDQKEIQRLCKIHNQTWLLQEMKHVHFYIALLDSKIVGIIGINKINPLQAKLQTFFVAYDHQKQGIATNLLNHLIHDEYYQTSNELVLSASISAYSYYLKQGFITTSNLNEFGLYEMKKIIMEESIC